MKIITLKYPGTCRDCGAQLAKGERAKWAGRGRIYGLDCHGKENGAGAVVGPCWQCGSAEGKFRSYGAASPVYCDECEREARQKDRERQPYAYRDNPMRGYEEGEPEGLTASRFDRHGVYSMDGRRIGSSCGCEDYPCCGH